MLLYGGGKLLVDGSVGFARLLHIPHVVIGLTIVAFGTSAPELFVSVVSALQGHVSVSIGNIVGSNIINISLILAISALFVPAAVSRSILKVDIPFMFFCYGALFLVATDFGGAGRWYTGRITRIEGVVLIALLVGYTIYRYVNTGASSSPTVDAPKPPEAPKPPRSGLPWLLIGMVAGILALGGGAKLLVDSAVWLAREVFHVSDRFIGITVVAFGTSLPELVTSLVAGIGGHADISLGNIVGSNIFNTLLVPGMAAVIGGLALESDFRLDIGVMLLISLLLLGFGAWLRRVPRLGGVLLLICYVGYTWLLYRSRGL